MARCKMEQPERADYLRVFCAILLTDEDYECLSREDFGSVSLLMYHAWAKKGSLPADPAKLSKLARCTIEELEALRKAWPKLVPLESLDPEAEPGARVTIPFLWKEWQQVMGFYKAQRDRSAKGVAARTANSEPTGLPETPKNEPMGQPTDEPMGQPLDIPYQAQAQAQTKREESKDSSCPESDKPTPEQKQSMATPGGEVLVWIDCNGTPAKWGLTKEKLDEWVKSFPGVDVKGEVRKAIQWLRDCPTRRKTARGMSKYINGWLSRANDRRRTQQATPMNRSPSHRADADEILRQQIPAEEPTGLVIQGANDVKFA